MAAPGSPPAAVLRKPSPAYSAEDLEAELGTDRPAFRLGRRWRCRDHDRGGRAARWGQRTAGQRARRSGPGGQVWPPPVCGAPLAPGRQIAARGPAVAVTGRTTSGAGSALFSPNGLSGGQPPAGGQPPQAGPVEENQGWSIFSYLIAGMVA